MGSGVSQTWVLLLAPPFPSCVSLGKSITSVSLIFVSPWYAGMLQGKENVPQRHRGRVTSLSILGGKSAIFLDGVFLTYGAPRFLPSFPARLPHPSHATLVVPALGRPPGSSAFRPGTSTLFKNPQPILAELFLSPVEPHQQGSVNLVCYLLY